MLAIGEAARRSGCSVSAIRFYEDENLLSQVSRAPNGRREYDGTTIERLVFIRRCRELGMRLDEIGSLVSLLDKDQASCAAVLDFTQAQLRAVRSRIRELRGLEQTLAAMVQGCSVVECGDGKVADCSIVTGLSRAQPVGR